MEYEYLERRVESFFVERYNYRLHYWELEDLKEEASIYGEDDVVIAARIACAKCANKEKALEYISILLRSGKSLTCELMLATLKTSKNGEEEL